MLSGLHVGGASVLGPAVIHILGPGAPGYVSWMQPKSGCVAYARMLTPSAGGVSPVSTTAPPSTPAEVSATFESEGVCLSEEHKKQLRALATERDAQRRPGGNDSDESWRNLLDHARYLFRAAALLIATCKLLHTCLIYRYVRHPMEHLLAKVLATAQKQSMEAATQ